MTVCDLWNTGRPEKITGLEVSHVRQQSLLRRIKGVALILQQLFILIQVCDLLLHLFDLLHQVGHCLFRPQVGHRVAEEYIILLQLADLLHQLGHRPVHPQVGHRVLEDLILLLQLFDLVQQLVDQRVHLGPGRAHHRLKRVIVVVRARSWTLHRYPHC